LSQNNSAILDFFSKFPNQPFEFVTVTDINIKEHPNYYKAIFKNIKTNKFHAQLIAPEMMRYKYKVGHIYTDGEHVGQNKTLLKGELTVNENIDVNLVRLSTVLSEEEAKNIIDYEDVTKYLLRQYAHVVKSKKSNERITSQSGAFLLFGIDAALNEQGTENIQIYRITIKKESKQKILAELDLLNINESSVFPYIENSAKYVAQKYKFKK